MFETHSSIRCFSITSYISTIFNGTLHEISIVPLTTLNDQEKMRYQRFLNFKSWLVSIDGLSIKVTPDFCYKNSGWKGIKGKVLNL